MIEQYLNQRVAIHCKTSEESRAINDLIVQHGGRDLHYGFNSYKDKVCYSMLEIGTGSNCYCNKTHWEKENYTIIPASEILAAQPVNYQIF